MIEGMEDSFSKRKNRWVVPQPGIWRVLRPRCRAVSRTARKKRYKVAATRAKSSEQAGLAARQVAAEVFVGAGRGDAAAGGAVNQPELHQVRFVHFFDGVFFLAEGRGQRSQAHRSARVFIEQG